MKNKRFLISSFFIYFVVLLLLGGAHYGLIVLIKANSWKGFIAFILPVVYWLFVAVGLICHTGKRVRDVYERPMQDLAKAAKKVAEGDFNVSISPTQEANKLEYLDAMIEDFNKMVGELKSVETLKTEFFSNVSHEIKTPISIIQNNAELLKKEELTEAGWEYADNIYNASKRLADLIGKMLKLNKLENQTIIRSAEPYDICAQITECVLAFDDVIEKREFDIEADMEDSCLIYADASLMEIVWNNLLENSVKFTDCGGQIRIRQWSEDGKVYVSVSDKGCGMSSEIKKHIFEKFYQGDTSHATAGNGLGLSLVKRVLQLEGFEIEVLSEEEQGSTFTVKMPAASGKEGNSGIREE